MAMKITEIIPPREFEVGFDIKRALCDCAHIDLKKNEQVTFTTSQGAEYDVTRKDFGFYATPSVNGRLRKFGLRTVLVRNRITQYFILLVERGRESLFEQYMKEEKMDLIAWLDDDEVLEKIHVALGKN
jgi:hypothetical protein